MITRHGAGLLVLLAVVAFFAAFAPRAARAEGCACDRYLSFIPQYSLAENVAAIGVAALHPEGHLFNVDAELAQKLREQVREDTRIPEQCRSYVSSSIHVGPRAALTVSGGYGGVPTNFSMTSSAADTVMGAYRGLLSHYIPCKRPAADADNTAYLACLQSKANSGVSKFNSRLAGASPKDLQSELAGYGYSMSRGDIAVMKAFNAAINSGDSTALTKWASGPGKKLSMDQFLNVVQMVGWELNYAAYDHERTNGGPNSGGIVSVSTILGAIRTDVKYMINSTDSDPADSLASFKGVCRDAAIMQVQMLVAYGNKNSYAVAYRTAHGGHEDVITQDPKNPLKLYTINWNGRATHEGLDGGQVLFQGGSGIPDYSTNYVISDYTGRNIASVPSEMGKFLTEAVGGNIQGWDPAARSNGSIIAVSLSPDSKGNIQFRALNGWDGNGQMYTGVAADAHWGVGSQFPGQVGMFFGQQLRPSVASQGSNAANGTALVAYGQVEQHAITPQFKMSPELTGVIDAHVIAAGAITNVMAGPDYSDSKANLNGGGDQRLGAEARIAQKALGGKLTAEYALGGNVFFGMADTRNEDPSGYTVVPANLYASARGTLRAGDATLFGQAMLIVDQLGVRNKVEVGVATRSVAASVYESGRVTNDTALIEDGTIRRAGVSLTVSPSRHLRLGVTGEIPLEGSVAAGARIYGTGNVVF